MYHNKLVATVKSNGKVLREDNGTVYLPFNSDYSILLKNLNSQRASVSITIDDEDILNGSSLIVDANSDLELERWLTDDNNCGPKLRFMEKTEEIREARGENNGMDGIVRISFRYEKPFVLPSYDPKVYRVYDPYYTDPWYKTTFGDIQNINVGSNVTNCVDGATQVSYTSSSDQLYSGNIRGIAAPHETKNEDGMTVKGEDSDQKFSNTFLFGLEDEEHVICLQLKGDVNQKKVKKAVTTKTPKVCSKCHQKNDWNAKFCKRCGNNLSY